MWHFYLPKTRPPKTFPNSRTKHKATKPVDMMTYELSCHRNPRTCQWVRCRMFRHVSERYLHYTVTSLHALTTPHTERWSNLYLWSPESQTKQQSVERTRTGQTTTVAHVRAPTANQSPHGPDQRLWFAPAESSHGQHTNQLKLAQTTSVLDGQKIRNLCIDFFPFPFPHPPTPRAGNWPRYRT
jgi:hypothetical protein